MVVSFVFRIILLVVWWWKVFDVLVYVVFIIVDSLPIFPEDTLLAPLSLYSVGHTSLL